MVIAAGKAIVSSGDLLLYSRSNPEISVTNCVPALPEGILKIFLLHFVTSS